MIGKPCSIYEHEEILKNGGKLIIYGEPVYFDKSYGVDPVRWYREKMSSWDIAVIVTKPNAEKKE